MDILYFFIKADKNAKLHPFAFCGLIEDGR